MNTFELMMMTTPQLDAWEQRCLNRVLVGRGARCEPESALLPPCSQRIEGAVAAPEVQRALLDGLAVCWTREQVQTLFAAARYLSPSPLPLLERGADWEESKHPRDKDGRFGHGGGVSSKRQQSSTTQDKVQHSRAAQAALQRVLEVHEQSQQSIVELRSERNRLRHRFKELESRYERATQVLEKAPTASARSQAEAQVQYVKGQVGRAKEQDNLLKKTLKDLRVSSLDTIHHLLYSSRSLSIKSDFLENFNSEAQRTLYQGFDVSARFMGDLPYEPSTLNVVKSIDGRSSFTTEDQTIVFHEKDRPRDVVHELGHWLECHDPTILQRTVSFYEKRTKGLKEELLSEITGIKDYKDETTIPDDFLHPYMGKVYRRMDGKIKATEILSMGLQYFFENPVALAEHDPEYFHLIYDIIHPDAKTKTASLRREEVPSAWL